MEREKNGFVRFNQESCKEDFLYRSQGGPCCCEGGRGSRVRARGPAVGLILAMIQTLALMGFAPDMSADGRYVVFQTGAALLPAYVSTVMCDKLCGQTIAWSGLTRKPIDITCTP